MKVLMRSKPQEFRKDRSLMSSVGAELRAVELDKITKTDPTDNRNRRTLLVTRQDGSWGFTLQSYGIHHKASNEIQLLTYVDYVDLGGPSYLAGLRPGDVILSINGISMEDADHSALVDFIKNSGSTMRMVVLFEDCCRKVELHLRYLKLQRILAEKMFEMRALEAQESRVLLGNSTDPRRLSLAYSSTTSCASLCDDRLSLRPELDVCPTPRALSPALSSSLSPLRGASASPGCSTPLAHLAPRFDFERSSLPVTHRTRPLSSCDLDSSSCLDGSFVREKRPLSMNLKRSLNSISELPACDVGKFPRRPDSLAALSLDSSASTSTLERLCVDARAKSWGRNDGTVTPPSFSFYSPDGSTLQSSPDGSRCGTLRISHETRSLTSSRSASSVLSPGSSSPRPRPRSSQRKSFRHRVFSPQNSPLPSPSVVLTEENSREDGEPILLGVKRIARAYSFLMPWEQKSKNGEAYSSDVPSGLYKNVNNQARASALHSCDSDASLTTPPLRSYKSREMLACSSPEWLEMDSLASKLDDVSVSPPSECCSRQTGSGSSVSSFESSASSGSYALTDPFSSPDSFSSGISFQTTKYPKVVANGYGARCSHMDHINEQDEVTVL